MMAVDTYMTHNSDGHTHNSDELDEIMARMTELHASLRRSPTEGQHTEFKQLMTRLRDFGVECNTLVDDDIVFWETGAQ